MPNPPNFLGIVVLILATAVGLAIFVPLTGVLVRYRANYNPKGLQLDQDGVAQPHTGPVIKSYFSMFRRVVKLEGWVGLFKGLMPTFMSTAVMTVLIVMLTDSERPRHTRYRAPETGVFGTLFYATLVMLLGLPTSIITYRAITTPHKLGYFQPMKSLRILLTPTERRKPWILYLTPGLLVTEMLHIAVIVLGVTPLRRVLLPPLEESDNPFAQAGLFKLIIYVLVLVFSTFILAPLEVMTTRLTIQRNHASAAYNSVTQEVEGDAEDAPEYAGAEEDVIGLRNEEDPYVGMVDCAKRIIDEEGWMALYRAWWVTLLGVLLSSIA